MFGKSWFERFQVLYSPESGSSPERYKTLRRSIIILMMLVTIVPLCIMALVSYHQYQTALREEIVNPVRVLVNKTKHSFELLFAERVSAISFIASAYPFEQLADENMLNRTFKVMKQELGGFVDLGLIDSNGIQVSYAGPYDLRGKSYAEQSWFHEVQIRGSHISDVFLGYRRFPHVVMAVQRRTDDGKAWTLRATINTDRFGDLIASMGLDASTDAFLLNKSGVFQTPSKFYGEVLDVLPFPLPPISYEPNVIELTDAGGNELLMAYTYFVHTPYVLGVVKPRGEALKSWYTLKSELVVALLGTVFVIFLVVFKLIDQLVSRLQECDQKREAAFREMQHSHKLSSIGRLAAGVAHEINNPLAIINEKAGLMKDLIELSSPFPEQEKFLGLAGAILKSADRCRSITHRLLGFARRMEVQIEVLDVNEVVLETLSFLEKESVYRNIDVRLALKDDLPRIASDRGQLQQVFLNILNNAFQAVEDGGVVEVVTGEEGPETVSVSVRDNGCGMSEETLKSIFEPFFTTKKGYGTGLGLPITYGIVKKLGGDIEVKSQEGAGTTVVVLLPLKPKEMPTG